MRCLKIQERLPAHLDESLGWWACRQVDAHLRECETCRRESRALARTVELLHLAGKERIPRDIAATVMARIAELPAPPRRAARPIVLVPATLAAAAALAISLQSPPRQITLHAPPPKNLRTATEISNAAYLQAYAQFRASQDIGDNTGMLLVACELTKDPR